MAIVDLLMPKMGESIMEATILKWLKNPGDKIFAGGKQIGSILELEQIRNEPPHSRTPQVRRE